MYQIIVSKYRIIGVSKYRCIKISMYRTIEVKSSHHCLGRGDVDLDALVAAGDAALKVGRRRARWHRHHVRHLQHVHRKQVKGTVSSNGISLVVIHFRDNPGLAQHRYRGLDYGTYIWSWGGGPRCGAPLSRDDPGLATQDGGQDAAGTAAGLRANCDDCDSRVPRRLGAPVRTLRP